MLVFYVQNYAQPHRIPGGRGQIRRIGEVKAGKRKERKNTCSTNGRKKIFVYQQRPLETLAGQALLSRM